ncbi:MAG: RIO1 family regulatory kinase/ATPase [Halonotius sp.]
MLLRRLVRGRVSSADSERVVQAVAERYGHETPETRFLDADNWLSTPLVIDEELFVKVISDQNTLIHALFTTGRNLGAFSSGTAGFFESFQTPVEMAHHELEATQEMQALGLHTPVPKEAFEVDGYGVVVFEYLPEFRPLDDLDPDTEGHLADELFAALATLHDAGLAHGDLRAENVLIRDEDLYFIDATSVNSEARAAIRSYDLACGLAALEPVLGARETVAAALSSYSADDLLEAADFLDFVSIRPDHDFEAAGLKSEIEKTATDSQPV